MARKLLERLVGGIEQIEYLFGETSSDGEIILAEELSKTVVYENPKTIALLLTIRNELTVKERKIIGLYFFEKHTIPQIAKRYGRNKSTISRQLKCGIQKINKNIWYYLANLKKQH